MEFPESLEQHLHQVVKRLIDLTTVELQRIFRHHLKANPGNDFWDLETGSELWRSCHTQLKPTSKQRIVKGQINKWSIADLAVLLPELMRRNGNMSLMTQYSEILKNVQALFKPFETGSFAELSWKKFTQFKLSLKKLLVRLDTDTMTVSHIIRDVISVRDLIRAVAKLNNISPETPSETIISVLTEILTTFPNLPPYFEEVIWKLRYCARVGTTLSRIDIVKECLKIISFDRSNAPAHSCLACLYNLDHEENPSFYFYHSRKNINLQIYRPHMFFLIAAFIKQQPTDPSCNELRSALQLVQKKNLSLTNHDVAKAHFQRAYLQHGNPLGFHAFLFLTIIMRDMKEDTRFQTWFKRNDNDNFAFLLSVNYLGYEVNYDKNALLFHKYGSSSFASEIVANAHFLLGYIHEKGLVPRDFDKAKSLYQISVTMYNSEMASYFLGAMYYEGAGVRKSYMWARLYWQHSIAFVNTEGPIYAIIDYFLKHLGMIDVENQASYLESINPQTRRNKQVNCLLRRLQQFKQHHLANGLENINWQVGACESRWQLSRKGLTLLERLKRVELLGFKHDFGDVIRDTYNFFKLSYGPERDSEGDGATMSEYMHGFDERLEVDYSQLFSRLYLVAPTRVYGVTTFRYNLATNQQPKLKIKYKTRSRAALRVKFPEAFADTDSPEQFTVVEDLLFTEKGGIYLMLEDRMSGAIQQLKVTVEMIVMRLKKHLKLEYGAKVTLSCCGRRSFVGNANLNFNDTLAPNTLAVIVMGKEEDMCRFCMDPIRSATECVCGFRYCGQTCLEKDRKYLNHKFLCVG